MKKLFTIIISSILLLSSFLTSCETIEQIKVGTVYGIVTKEGSTEPLSAVPVGLYKDDSLMLQTVTYEDGHFEFDNLLEGYYDVKIDALGYEIEEISVYVESQRVARADMQLKLIDIGLHVITNDPVILNGIVGLSLGVDNHYGYDELGFYYSTSENPTISGKQVKIQSHSSTYELKNIDSGVYYIVAYAKNSKGTTYGEVKSFTFKIQPIMSVEVSNITNSSASFTCYIDNANKITIIERGFVYSSFFSIPSIDDPSPETIKRVVSGDSEDFSANVANLIFNNKYYSRAYVKLSSGIYYSDVISFKATIYDLPEFENAGQKYNVSPNYGTMTQSSAISFCKNLTYGGYSDWILPNHGMLKILYQNKKNIGGFLSDDYWSSDQEYYDTYNGWNHYYLKYIDFYDGKTWKVLDEKDSGSINVRCIRSVY